VSSSNVIYSSSNSPICRTIIVVRFIIGCVNRYTIYSLELPRSFTSLQPFKTSLLLSLLISTISILGTFFVFFQVAFSFFFLASRYYFSPFYFLLRVASNFVRCNTYRMPVTMSHKSPSKYSSPKSSRLFYY
jgi:hypothetical protein